jgi:hypothetical protein
LPASANEVYLQSIPNGKNAAKPFTRALGHTGTAADVGQYTQFGKDYQAAGRDWAKLCAMDSDKDGQTNGEELGDPCCVWKVGSQPVHTTGISDPSKLADKTTNAPCPPVPVPTPVPVGTPVPTPVPVVVASTPVPTPVPAPVQPPAPPPEAPDECVGMSNSCKNCILSSSVPGNPRCHYCRNADTSRFGCHQKISQCAQRDDGFADSYALVSQCIDGSTTALDVQEHACPTLLKCADCIAHSPALPYRRTNPGCFYCRTIRDNSWGCVGGTRFCHGRPDGFADSLADPRQCEDGSYKGAAPSTVGNAWRWSNAVLSLTVSLSLLLLL